MGNRSEVSRRGFLGGTAAFGAAALTASHVGSATAAPANADTSTGYLVGVGRGDVTGVIAGQGMMGYSDLSQVASGLLQRVWARAYIIADAATGKRVVFVNADLSLIFDSHRVGVMAELRRRYGSTYTDANVNLNATHNHNSCGGTAWDYAYILAAYGHRKNSYRAEVDGIVDAIVAAHDNLSPGTLSIGHSELHDASANRSIQAFAKNPAADRKVFPGNVDPQVTSLQLRQSGKVVGEITWFATHGTSMTDANTLISTDNKGYASYLAETRNPDVLAAFPQTNAGDMTPNLRVRKLNPGGPTDNHRANCQIIGDRQYRAGRRALDSTQPLTGTIDYAHRFINMGDVRIDGDYTPDGRPARTTPAIMGAGAAATSTEDNTRSQLPFLSEGMVLPFAQALGVSARSTPPDWVQQIQAPKVPLFPLGYMPPRPWIQEVLPIQIIRIGDLVLAAGPAEFTIVSGLRIRRVVADALRVRLENVLLQGYSNGYSQYVTTPEEYVSQQYEGGETLFGQHTLCAYMQEFDHLARAMASGRKLSPGPTPPDTSGLQPDLLSPTPPDSPVQRTRFGDVVTAPKSRYSPNSTATVTFSGAHPRNRVRRTRPSGSVDRDRYFTIERFENGRWATAVDDNAWECELSWKRPANQSSASLITITWRIPRDAHGRYRIRYFGDVKTPAGKLRPIAGVSPAFQVGT